MSVNSVVTSHWFPSTTRTSNAASTAPTGSAFPTSTGGATATPAAGTNTTTGSTDPMQQLSAELQAVLVQLQGGAGNPAAPSGSTPGQQASATAVPSAAASGAPSSGTISGHHRHARHDAGQSGQAGDPAADATSAVDQDGATDAGDASGAAERLQSFAKSLVSDIANAVRSYAKAGSTATGAGTASSSTAGVALAA